MARQILPLITCTLLSLGVLAASPPMPEEVREDVFFQTEPGQLIQNRDWQTLERKAIEYAKPDAVGRDGRPRSYLFAASLYQWLQTSGPVSDPSFPAQIAAYRKAVPNSVFVDVLEAMYLQSTAHSARGYGSTDSVTPAQRKLFNERSAKAWERIQSAKQRTAALPYWYLQALLIGKDMNIGDKSLRAMLEEGLKRFPGYFPLYFNFSTQAAWQAAANSRDIYKSMDQFITSAVMSTHNTNGEALYARLYWYMDQLDGNRTDFFENTLVDWQRMRAGFEFMLKQYPRSTWNHANFVVYACRANDATTYNKLRPKLDEVQFSRAAPLGLTLKDCDRRLQRMA